MREFVLKESPENIDTLKNNEERDERATLAIKYDRGVVSSSKFEDMSIKGCIFFVLGPGKLPKIERSTVDEAQEVLNTLAKSLLSRNEKYYEKFQSVAENALHLVPQWKFPEKKLTTFLKANGVYWFLDDYLDNLIDLRNDKMDQDLIFEVANLVEDIFHGKKSVQDINLES